MNSIAFPKMFKSSSTKLVYDKEASAQNLRLLLSSEKGEFCGDPSFGVSIRKFYYDQNGFILEDIIVDEIYTQIKIFMPQLTVNRDNIKIVQRNEKLYARITGINKLDFTTNTLELAIFQEDER